MEVGRSFRSFVLKSRALFSNRVPSLDLRAGLINLFKHSSSLASTFFQLSVLPSLKWEFENLLLTAAGRGYNE